MNAKIVSKEIPITTSRTFNEVQITLSTEEAVFLTGLLGNHIIGAGPLRKISNSIWEKLNIVIVCPNPFESVEDIRLPDEIPSDFKDIATRLKNERTG